MLQRAMPESCSDGSNDMESPSLLWTEGKLAGVIVFGEVCILDSLNANTIMEAYASGDFTPSL